MSTAVHMIIKALCKLGNNALLLCIALISDALANFPALVATSAFPVLHVCFTAHSWLPQGTILVNSCNSGNCQNNKCFFAVNWVCHARPTLVSTVEKNSLCRTYLRTYVLVLVLITPKSLPALILRVLASFVNSKTVHKLTTQREDTNRHTSLMATARTATTWQ